MKRIVSVSIGSSCRDKSVESEILGERYIIERIGTDGNIGKAIEIIKSLDGKIEAFGMGGIDLYLTTGSSKRYMIREAVAIKEAAKLTPIVDGSGIKNTLEKRVVEYLKNNGIIEFKGKNVLITSAADRFKMAEAFFEAGCHVTIGDFIFALGIPLPIKSLKAFRRIADIAIPLVSRLPFELLYPTGDKQKKINNKKFAAFYQEADIIAGDYHYIKKYMPDTLCRKVIITNTVTSEDVKILKARGVSVLVTTTPEWDGRSFGTNVIEALLISASGKQPDDLSQSEYYDIIDRIGFKPRIEYLN